MKLFFDIIPPKKSETKKLSSNRFMKRLILKTICLLIIVALNWTGLSAVIETFAYFNNTENSSGNLFQAGILDFELQSLNDFPEVCAGEPTERTISIVNYGNPFKYKASSTEFSGEICDYVTLEANVDGEEPEYVGPLTNFNYGPLEFSDPDDWVFKATFNPNLPAEFLGQTCTFKFVFDGSQTKNDLPFGQGFNDSEEIISNILAKICCWTEIRSCGYWKNHPNVYKPHLPQTLGGYPTDEIVDTVWKADKILTAACGNCGCGCDKTMRGKLKGQLLAMKFNIAHFGIGEYLVESEGKTLNQIVAEADELLRQDPPPLDEVLEGMKDLLDQLNNLEHIRFCAVPLPPEGCVLQLTKTASSEEVGRGDVITHHLTFDNIGDEVCTGGGVRLKDAFDKSQLQYQEYNSTRQPKSFNQGCGYVEWNFGNIYPDDPLIEIDLKMKVKSSAQCDSTITNSANYWSNETDWGEPVTVDTHVICPPLPPIVINEFLPNPKGKDNAPMPNGEWVELYNKGESDVDVAGWMLYDEKDSNELPITPDNTNTGSTTVPAGGFLVVYRNGDGDFALDNKGGDTVRLYDGKISDGANLIDSHTYTIDALEGKSFARIPNGSDNWEDPIPTPGEPNVMDEGVETDFGPAVAEEGEEGYEEVIEDVTKEIIEEGAVPASVTGGGGGAPEEEPFIEEPAEEQPGEEQTEQPVEEPVVEETTAEETPAEQPIVEETPIIEEPATLPENEILDELSNAPSEDSQEPPAEIPAETPSETTTEAPAETPTETPSPAPEI
jgi:hypothetical protein